MASVAFAAKSADEHVQSVRQIGSLLAEYTQKKKSTPFSENWKQVEEGKAAVPIICNLSENKIPNKLAFPPHSCTLFSADQIESYLSDALGRKIKLPLDDRDLNQRGKVVPVFYTILITKDKFFVSTYLTEPHDEARKLGNNWYKFEVGSIAYPEKKIEKAILPSQK